MILVTGATGFIGSHFVERAVADGRGVRCLVRRTSSLTQLPPVVELAYGDLAQGAGLSEALEGVDSVVHLAGVTKARTQAEYYRGNVEATANLLKASGEVKRFVHVSSLAAAGPSKASQPVREDAVPHPVSHYGRAKLAGEQAVLRSAVRDRAVIVRPPVVYGPRDHDVFEVIRAVSKGWLLRIGTEERRFSLVYVMDLVEGLMAALDRQNVGGRTFFLAHAQAVSWDEFGAATARLLGRKLRTASVPPPLAYALGAGADWWTRVSGKPGILSRDKVSEACCEGWVCDPALASRDLGFCAATGLEEGLRLTLDWYREAGWLRF
ncbi:MAG: NAD-dependent epimerase/dehydratase family protein [Bryobacteraceae bacterium]